MHPHDRSRGLSAIVFGAGLLSAIAAGQGVAQGVRYTVAPAAIHFKWKDNFGLEDVTLWGGRAGATFGQLVSLDGYYFRRGDVGTGLAGTGLLSSGGAALVDQALDLQHYGVDLRVNLGGGRWHPFVSGGVGVLRFEPESSPRFDQIVIKYGGGLQFELTPGLAAQVFVENNRLRLDRYRFAVPDATPYPADPDAGKGRDHLSFGAALGIALGGNGGDRGREHWSFASIPIEPYVGRLEYDDPSLDHQWFGGVRGGVDVGQYFGLRGYYLRGIDDDFDDLSRVQSYGAEAQFNFNRGVGPAPFLLAGVGRLDFKDGFVDPDGRSRTDRDLFIVGAGLGLRLSDQLRVNFTARDWITSGKDFEVVSDVSDLQHNLMLSAGLAFALGRGRTNADDDRDRDRDRDDRDRDRDRDRDQDRDRDRDDRNRDEARRYDRRDESDTVRVRRPMRKGSEEDRKRIEADAKKRDPNYVSDREATFPVPTEGEIYIRYGKGVTSTMEGGRRRMEIEGNDSSLRAIVKEELRRMGVDSLATRPTDRNDSARAQDDSVRMARVIRETIVALDRERGIAPTAVVRQTDTVTTSARADAGRSMTLRQREPSLYGGFNIDRPHQLVIGGVMDLTPSSSRSRFRFLPEVALGFGSGGTSLLAAANVGSRFGSLRVGSATIMPQARVGFGLLTYSGSVENRKSTQGVLNLTYGFTSDLIRIGGLGRPLLTVEHQGIDLFDSNRLLVGLVWRR